MTHWKDRHDIVGRPSVEAKWKAFKFNQPYARGLKRLKEDVLAKTDFDPATLWQWGTMQAMALIEILKDAEATFGAEGQKLVYRALHKTGLDVGRQILAGIEIPPDLSEVEFVSFYATVINRIAYASLEEPRIDSDDKATFDIVWCPHQDHYGAFDCRVQRYFVAGMIEAAREIGLTSGDGASEKTAFDFDVRFDSTIPSGAHTCHFTMWKGDDDEKKQWAGYTALLDAKALTRAVNRDPMPTKQTPKKEGETP